MTQDDDFSRLLRDRVDEVRPAIAVDTTRVVPRARRRRAVARTGGALALTLVLGGAGWVLDAQPWNSPTVVPAGQGGLRVAGDVTPTPTVNTADVGWPDAPFWHTVSEATDDTGKHTLKNWLGHSKPGMLLQDDDVPNAIFRGPSGWGNLVIDGKWTLVSWDVLYGLPRDPAALEALFRASIQPDAGVGSDDDKVFAMAHDMQLDSPAPPTLKKALWAVMAALPNATVTTGVHDAIGRPGSLLKYTDSTGAGQDNAGGTSFETVFDPEDGRLLEHRNPPLSPSTILEEGPATSTPIEPSLEKSGCTAWASC